MQVGLNEAARLAGKDQSTITRAYQAGRLSFTKDARGNPMFDPAELERVYGPLRPPEEPPPTDALERAIAAEVAGLQQEVPASRSTCAPSGSGRWHNASGLFSAGKRHDPPPRLDLTVAASRIGAGGHGVAVSCAPVASEGAAPNSAAAD